MNEVDRVARIIDPHVWNTASFSLSERYGPRRETSRLKAVAAIAAYRAALDDAGIVIVPRAAVDKHVMALIEAGEKEDE